MEYYKISRIDTFHQEQISRVNYEKGIDHENRRPRWVLSNGAFAYQRLRENRLGGTP